MPKTRAWGGRGLKGTKRMSADVAALSDKSKKKRIADKALEDNVARNQQRIKKGKKPLPMPKMPVNMSSTLEKHKLEKTAEGRAMLRKAAANVKKKYGNRRKK